MSNKSKVILGLIGAAAAGAVIGLLLAPEKGTDTRKRISKTATDWADHLTDLFANAKGELQNLRKKGTTAANDLKDEATNTANKVSESYS
jgi:gas vesicle protein